MALARERTTQSAQQGFDPSSSSLDFFGGCSDGHITSLFDLQESQPVVNVKAYSSSSSSVLSFEQGGRLPEDTKYYNSQLDQEEECAAWINMMDHHGPRLLTRDTNCFEMTDGYGCVDGQQEDRFGLLHPSTANCMIVQLLIGPGRSGPESTGSGPNATHHYLK